MKLGRGALAVLGASLLMGCGHREIRVHNATAVDFHDVTIAGQAYGHVAAGETTSYRSVDTVLGYATMYLTAGGFDVNAQTLTESSKPLTFEVHILDLAAGHLDVQILKD